MTDFKRLGDIATYINGYAFKPEDRGNEGLPIIRIQDLTGNSYDLGFYNGEYPERIEINDGDVLISWSGSLGVYLWNKGKALLNQHIFKVVFDKAEIDKSYFIYAIQHHLKEMEDKTHGATMKHITKKDFDNMLVPYPNMQKQREIADILSTVDRIIASCQQELTKMDELVKSRFVEMFGENIDCSEKAFLEDISEFVTVGIANSATHAYSDNGVVMLRNQNIKENYLDDADLIHITPEFAEKYGSKQLEENDILVIRTGYPGIACLVPRKYAGCQTFTTLIVRLKDSSRIHANYVCHYINSSFGKEYVELSKVGVAQQNFGAKALAKMPIRIPSFGMQEEFSAFIEQTDKSKLAVKQSLEKLETLKKSLMQQYFG